MVGKIILSTSVLVLYTVCALPFDNPKINGTNTEDTLYSVFFRDNFIKELLSKNDKLNINLEGLKNIQAEENVNEPRKSDNSLIDVIKVVEKIGQNVGTMHKPWTVIVQEYQTEATTPKTVKTTATAEITTAKTTTAKTTTAKTEKTTESTTASTTEKSTEKPTTQSTTAKVEPTTQKTTVSEITQTTEGTTLSVETTEADVASTTDTQDDKNFSSPMIYKVTTSMIIQCLVVAVAAILM